MITKKSKGGGLAINPNHIFADSTARDAYFALHPTELVKGTFISVGTDYEEYDGVAFAEKTAIITGPAGLAGSIQVGTVTTLPAGSSATVVNMGTTNSAIFDFGIPKGADGAGGGSATWGGITGTLSAQTDLNSALSGKQATLVSGTNIKTINGTSVLGSGNIVISGGGGGAVDSVNGQTGTVVLTQDNIADGTTYKQYSEAEKTKLSNITGTNTGDETTSTIKTKLGAGSTSTDGYITSTDWNTFNGKQDGLISGTNIKTINGTSVLGSGDITVSGSGAGVTVYSDLAALKAVDTTAYTDVQTVQVATLGLYKFQPLSTLTGDDVNVITPTTGSSAGRWIKQSVDTQTITVDVIDPLTNGGSVTGTTEKNINIEKENSEVLVSKKTRPTKTRKVLFLGSSVCGGLGATTFAESYQGLLTTALQAETEITYIVENKCIGGNNATEIINRFVKSVVPFNPDVVFIGISSNNEVITGATGYAQASAIAKEFKIKLGIIISLCKQYGYDYFVGGEYGNNTYTVSSYNAKKQLNFQLSKWLGNKFFNWYGNSATDGTGAFKTGTFSNGTHPNSLGHANLFNAINVRLFNGCNSPFIPFKYWGGDSEVTVGTNGYPLYYKPKYNGTAGTALREFTVSFEARKNTGANSVTLTSIKSSGGTTVAQIKIDANGYYATYNSSTLVTTSTVLASKYKKDKIVIRSDYTLNLIKVFINGVEISSFTPTNGTSLGTYYLGSDGTSATTALNYCFANLVIYGVTLDIYCVNKIFQNDYPQSNIEFAHTLNMSNTEEFHLTSQTQSDEIALLGATQCWTTTITAENTFTDTEKTKLANIGKVGTAVASATSITAPSTVFHVTGTTAISTITVPYTGFTGNITIIPDAIFTLATGGNIYEAYTAVVGRAIQLCYDGTTWYRVNAT